MGASNHSDAFLYSRGQLQRLFALGGNPCGEVRKINNAGQVVGTLPDPSRAFLYNQGVLKALGTLPGHGSSWATDINVRGQVVGGSAPGDIYQYHDVPRGMRSFLYEEGVIKPLGSMDSTANSAIAINSQGWVVGEVWVGGEATIFVHFRDRTYKLRPANWGTFSAADINDLGQIAGFGYGAGPNAFLLTPKHLAEELERQHGAAALGNRALVRAVPIDSDAPPPPEAEEERPPE